MHRFPSFPAACLLAALATAAPAAGQQVVLYRCTGADGQLTVQNSPCPPGSQQREQVVGGVAATPGAATGPTSTVRTANGEFLTTSTDQGTRLLDSATLPRGEAAEPPRPQRPAPPPLHRCLSREGDRYLSEVAEPTPRCIPLRTVGLDGDPAAGAGQACEVVRDRCEAVDAADACQAWRDHARQAQTRWRLAHPDNAAWRQREYERIAAIVAASCGD